MNLVAYFSYYAILIQISVIYFHACVGKFGNPEWVDGTAVYYWFNDPTFGTSQTILYWFNDLLKSPLVVTTLTWGTLIVELILFSRLFYSNRRAIHFIFILGVLFHFSIIVFFGLISFFFAMLGALILYTLWTDDFVVLVQKQIYRLKRLFQKQYWYKSSGVPKN